MMSSADMVSSNLKMALVMRVIGKMICKVEKVRWSLVTEDTIKANGKME